MDLLETLTARLGQPLPPTRWFEITQAMIDAHADTHQDWQFIHVDPARATDTPFGGTIAHGFLTLSMLSAMVYDTDLEPKGLKLGLNYGFNKLRFLSPVRAGARVRGHFTPLDIAPRGPGELLQTLSVSVEIEGETKPALVAEWLNLYVLED
jgi:acyl dehydratase